MTPSANGKNASEATTEFLIFFGENFFAFCIAILQLSSLLGCPAPIPIVEKLLHRTIAFDLTNLLILKANFISANSFLLGFNFVTHLNFVFQKHLIFLNQKRTINNLIVDTFLDLYFDISIILKFFFLRILRALENP